MWCARRKENIGTVPAGAEFKMARLRSVLASALLVLAACAGVLAADKFPTENDVYVLTDKNFDDFMKQNDMVLVEFCMSRLC